VHPALHQLSAPSPTLPSHLSMASEPQLDYGPSEWPNGCRPRSGILQVNEGTTIDGPQSSKESSFRPSDYACVRWRRKPFFMAKTLCRWHKSSDLASTDRIRSDVSCNTERNLASSKSSSRCRSTQDSPSYPGLKPLT